MRLEVLTNYREAGEWEVAADEDDEIDAEEGCADE